MLTDTTGVVEIDVPRDRSATFEPQIVKKRHDQPATVPTIDRPTLQIDADAFSSAWSAFERATHAATFQSMRTGPDVSTFLLTSTKDIDSTTWSSNWGAAFFR